MPMQHRGLAKLCEESGELQQVIGKLLQYPMLQHTREVAHPDGTILLSRLEEEMGDVLGALKFVTDQLKLNTVAITDRSCAKLALFEKWSREP